MFRSGTWPTLFAIAFPIHMTLAMIVYNAGPRRPISSAPPWLSLRQKQPLETKAMLVPSDRSIGTF